MELTSLYRETYFVNLSIGALDIVNRSLTPFVDMMKELEFDDNTRKFIIKRLEEIYMHVLCAKFEC